MFARKLVVQLRSVPVHADLEKFTRRENGDQSQLNRMRQEKTGTMTCLPEERHARRINRFSMNISNHGMADDLWRQHEHCTLQGIEIKI